MGKLSREKGKRGEREVAALLRRRGYEARRGRQYKGTADSPDVAHNMPGVYIEVKLREQLSLFPALEKAESETKDAPIVFHRRKQKRWVVIMYAEDFLDLVEHRK
jgi:Holliday junction resolvase